MIITWHANELPASRLIPAMQMSFHPSRSTSTERVCFFLCLRQIHVFFGLISLSVSILYIEFQENLWRSGVVLANWLTTRDKTTVGVVHLHTTGQGDMHILCNTHTTGHGDMYILCNTHTTGHGEMYTLCNTHTTGHGGAPLSCRTSSEMYPECNASAVSHCERVVYILNEMFQCVWQ